MTRDGQLAGQKVLVIGGSSGIGLKTAKSAKLEGAEVILTGRHAKRLQLAARETGALKCEAFDATDSEHLARFFDELPTPIDHIMIAAGAPYYARLVDINFAQAHKNVEEHFWLSLYPRESHRTRFC